MNARDKQNRLAEFERLCRESGVPCTIQRRAILESTLGRDDHPTASQVFESVRETHRGVSKATIHRTLETLVKMGVITKTCYPGSAVRYDARTDIHHHLVCLRCDGVVDIEDANLDSLEIPNTSNHGFEVTDFRVQLRGICRNCREEGSKQSEG